jgi:glutamine amidotransferase
MIAIPSLPIGNFASVIKVVDKSGGHAILVDSPVELRDAEKIILVGVGAFDHGMSSLENSGWIDALNEAVLNRRVPILGICLGMQLLCKSSEEGQLPGLGWIDAEVKRFNLPSQLNFKIPHMGWNTVDAVKPNPLIRPNQGEQRFYFVHSYHAVCNNPDNVLAIAHYGYDFAAAVSHENIFGVQFHPEKSHRFGVALMKNFVEL